MQMNDIERSLSEEIKRRRTFAIISHPDAGKTTLTEKLLLYGGAIRLAGSVKARKAARHATSDWMEIEKQRGISVTSSAMQFDFGGCRINILDTPGHQDFSEDTYRTLMAADSAVMLIDGAKGVEEQTIKLFNVTKKAGIPVFTFVNKMDRSARDPFELMDEIESVLGIRCCPITWPIGVDGDFQGVFHRQGGHVELYSGGRHGSKQAQVERVSISEAKKKLAGHYLERLEGELELLDGAGDEFDIERVRNGELSPMFFGSAMNNFGVESFLERFIEYTSPPFGREAEGEVIDPLSPDFSGFIFKIQANMNPAHRDRIAFMRVCSGIFKRGEDVWHARAERMIKPAQPQSFMADERKGVDEAYPGDIIGLFDPGIFALGDTLCTGRRVKYAGIPLFAPEHFSRVWVLDSLRRKQFQKGVTQLAEEGAVQTFKYVGTGREDYIVGVVGVLQFDVLMHRLKSEYGVEASIEPLSFRHVRWIAKSAVPPDKLRLISSTKRGVDRRDRDVLLFENDWSIHWALENNDGLELTDVAER